jgi:hypothetical protein
VTHTWTIVLYVVLLIAVIVTGDVLFLKDRFWERLIANVAIVVIFAAGYLVLLRRS